MRPRSTTLIPSSGSMTSFSASSTWSKSAGLSVAGIVRFYLSGLGQFGGGCRGGLGGVDVTVVALFLQAVGELGTALLRHPAGDEDVHEVRLDVAEDARVVRDQQDAETGVRLGAVHTLRHDLQRI